MGARQSSVWVVGGICVAILILFSKESAVVSPVVLSVDGQPTIGSGDIQMVVFEDLLCQACQEFHEEIFPQIFSHYIQPNVARYSVVLLAYVEESYVPANAALTVYREAPSQFFPFVKELFQRRSWDVTDILLSAARVGNIDLENLSNSMEEGRYYEELEKNFALAQETMQEKFRTPALFIEGNAVSTSSFRVIQRKMEQLQDR